MFEWGWRGPVALGVLVSPAGIYISRNIDETLYTTAQAVELVLRRCGDNLTRDNVMKQAASFERVSFDLLLPGIEVNTSPRDFTAIKDMNLMRFEEDSWKLFGGLVRARAPE